MLKKVMKRLIDSTKKMDESVEKSIENIVKYQTRINEESYRLKRRKG